MREFTHRLLSVVLMLAVVSAASFAWINLGQGPEPVDQYGVAQEGDAVAVSAAAVGMFLAGSATVGLMCVEDVYICNKNLTAIKQAERVETLTEVSTRASYTSQQARLMTDSMSNFLNGTASIAREKAMRVFWNKTRNGRTLTDARRAAVDAAEDYLYVKVTQIASSWNTMARAWHGYHQLEENSNLSSGAVKSSFATNFDGLTGHGNATYTAPNGKTVKFLKFEYGSLMTTSPVVENPDNVYFIAAANSDKVPTSRSPSVQEYAEMLDTIEAQADRVRQQVRTLANKTYKPIKSGDISIEEYLSADTIARNYAAQNSTMAWAAVRLSQLENVGLPVNLSSVETITVTVNGTNQISGLFLSAHNPASGQFETGVQYNASAIPGEQYMLTDGGNYERLTGKFRIDRITTPSGGNLSSITIREPRQTITNMTAFVNRIERLRELRADINARQQRLMNTGGSSLVGDLSGMIPGLNGVQTAALLLLVLIATVAYAGREGGRTTVIERNRRN